MSGEARGNTSALIRDFLHAYPDPFCLDPSDASDAFWKSAATGGVDGLVAHATKVGAPNKDGPRDNAAHALRLRITTREILTELASAGIDALALKGPYLAARLYDNVGLRPTFDIDILVKPSQLARACRVLEAEDFRIVAPETVRYYLRHHHHITLERDGIGLELHFRACSGLGSFVPATPLLRRAHGVTLGSEEVLVLQASDEFALLAVHLVLDALHRGFLRDILLLDLKLLFLKEHPSWSEIRARAREWRYEHVVAGAVIAANKRTGLSLGKVPASWRTLGERIERRLPSERDSIPSGLKRAAIGASLTDSPSQGIRQFAGELTRPFRRRVSSWLGPSRPEAGD